jgi:hypothetical protein
MQQFMVFITEFCVVFLKSNKTFSLHFYENTY